jgi:type VI protein secretion system component VasK
MLELASRVQPLIQNLVDTLVALPWWAALTVLVIPSALAIVTGQVWVIAATVLLDAASIALLPSLGTRAAVVSLYTLSLVVALIGFRERRQTRWQADVDERLEHVAKQMMAFLQALDRRTQEIERMRAVSLATRATAPPAPPLVVRPAAPHSGVS